VHSQDISCACFESFGDVAVTNNNNQVIKRNGTQVQPPLVSVAWTIRIIDIVVDNESRLLLQITYDLGAYEIARIHPNEVKFRGSDGSQYTGTNEPLEAIGTGMIFPVGYESARRQQTVRIQSLDFVTKPAETKGTMARCARVTPDIEN
jgi:hypothetical protein